MASTTKSPRHCLKDIFGNRHKHDQQRRSTKQPFKQRGLSKQGFNNQVSKACFAGCLWKLAQRGATRRFNKGALKHKRWGKDGFDTKSPRHCLQDVFGNWRKEDQQTHSTRKPLSTEGGARMASTTKSPMHLLKDVFKKLAQRPTDKDIQQGSP